MRPYQMGVAMDPKASATCLGPQYDKSPGRWGRAPKNAQHLFIHSFTKRNLTNV